MFYSQNKADSCLLYAMILTTSLWRHSGCWQIVCRQCWQLACREKSLLDCTCHYIKVSTPTWSTQTQRSLHCLVHLIILETAPSSRSHGTNFIDNNFHRRGVLNVVVFSLATSVSAASTFNNSSDEETKTKEKAVKCRDVCQFSLSYKLLINNKTWFTVLCRAVFFSA